MKSLKSLSISLLAAAAIPCATASVTFSPATPAVLDYAAPVSTGLNRVYVLPNKVGTTVSTPSANARWYMFTSSGAAYAVEVEESRISRGDGRSSVKLSSGDIGLVIENGTSREYYWLVDYAQHEMEISSISPAAEQDCARAIINVDGSADRILYYTINGRPEELSREISVTYNTLAYDSEAETYRQEQTEATLPYFQHMISVPTPLCDTYFSISEDRFQRAWGIVYEVQSPWFPAVAVEAETKAVQTPRSEDADNEQRDDQGDDSLGGSAPCEVTFTAAVTDAAIFRQWEMSRDTEFADPFNTFQDIEFTYTFTEQGTTYVRFIANNADGTCQFTGPVYSVFVGESRLEIPNAFSPGASEGVNDLWKVSYRSLVTYECHIFNRWGTRMFSSTNPTEGWDGKYRGKLVPAGVYYYVIKATGADGVKYSRSGDINIINYTSAPGVPGAATE